MFVRVVARGIVLLQASHERLPRKLTFGQHHAYYPIHPALFRSFSRLKCLSGTSARDVRITS